MELTFARLSRKRAAIKPPQSDAKDRSDLLADFERDVLPWEETISLSRCSPTSLVML